MEGAPSRALKLGDKDADMAVVSNVETSVEAGCYTSKRQVMNFGQCLKVVERQCYVLPRIRVSVVLDLENWPRDA